MNSKKTAPEGANIAGVPIEEPQTGAEIPASDGNGDYIPRHLSPEPAAEPARPDRGRGDYVPMPDGSNIAPNGAVIRNPWSDRPEITPDNEYTDEKEDLNLLIM